MKNSSDHPVSQPDKSRRDFFAGTVTGAVAATMLASKPLRADVPIPSITSG